MVLSEVQLVEVQKGIRFVPNYVRACFYINEPVGDATLQSLLRSLATYHCHLVREFDVLELAGTLALEWNLLDKSVPARFLQIWHSNSRQGMISFDVEDPVFFPGRMISYFPADDKLFPLYKLMLTNIVTHLAPSIGIFDYEADLLCPIATNRTLASWGDYFPLKWLDQWSVEDRRRLDRIADEIVTIEALGVMTFIHPMAANGAWTNRHQELEELLRHYLA